MSMLVYRIGSRLFLGLKASRLSFLRIGFFSEVHRNSQGARLRRPEPMYSMQSISSVVVQLKSKRLLNEKLMRYLTKALDVLESDSRLSESSKSKNLLSNLYKGLAEALKSPEENQLRLYFQFFRRKSFLQLGFPEVKDCLGIVIDKALQTSSFSEIFALLECIAEEILLSHEREIAINKIKHLESKDWLAGIENEREILGKILFGSPFLMRIFKENLLSENHFAQLSSILAEKSDLIKSSTLLRLFGLLEKRTDTQSTISRDQFAAVDGLTAALKHLIDEGYFKKEAKRFEEKFLQNENFTDISKRLKDLPTSHVIGLGYLLNQHYRFHQIKLPLQPLVINEGLRRITNLRECCYFSPMLYKAFWGSDLVLEKVYRLNAGEKASIISSKDPSEVFHYLLMISMAFIYSDQNKFVNSMLKDLDSILSRKLPTLSLEQKCVLLPYLKNINTPSKHYACKFLIRNLDKIKPWLLPGVLLQLSDYSYNMVDYGDIERIVFDVIDSYEFSPINYLDIIKSFLLPAKGSDEILLSLLKKLEKRILNELSVEDSFLRKNGNYPRMQCFLYQIIYTLSVERPLLLKELKINSQYFSENNISNLKEVYILAGRGNSNKREQNKHEQDLEFCLKDMGLAYQREKTIDLFSIDFLVNENIIIELYGLHHYCDKSNLTATSWWRERLLRSLGYKLISIPLKRWLQFPNRELRINFLRDLLGKDFS